MPRPSRTLRLGDEAPELALDDATTGATHTLASLLADQRGALLVFHRGMW